MLLRPDATRHRQAMGQAARRRIETQFGLSQMIERYARLYRSIGTMTENKKNQAEANTVSNRIQWDRFGSRNVLRSANPTGCRELSDFGQKTAPELIHAIGLVKWCAAK